MYKKSIVSFNSSQLLTILSFCFVIAAMPACAQHGMSGSNVAETSNNSSTITDVKAMKDDILEYINEYRVSKNLPALKMNDIASVEATQHSLDMAKGAVAFGHDGFNDRMANVKKQMGFIHGFAENVAYGKIDAREVVDMWLKSPGHKKNIEGNYAQMGIGIARNQDGYLYFTQIFLLP